MLLDESDLVTGDTATCYFVGTKKTSIVEIGFSIAEKPQFSLEYPIPAGRTSHFSLWGTTERVGFENCLFNKNGPYLRQIPTFYEVLNPFAFNPPLYFAEVNPFILLFRIFILLFWWDKWAELVSNQLKGRSLHDVGESSLPL